MLQSKREDFEAFVRDRLTPGIQQIGIEGQPSVQFETAASVFIRKA